jgi:hypothetical protein
MRSRIRSAIRAIDERATRSPDLTCGLLAGVCRTSSPAARVRRSCRSRGVDVPVRTACSSRSAPASARFGTKIAIAVRADLEQWQKLNITAFLASGIASGAAETTGKPYEDGSGHRYLEMFRQPVLVYAADGPLLGAARERALARGMPTAIYTQELFAPATMMTTGQPCAPSRPAS